MNIKRFNQYLKENLYETPETLVSTALTLIKNKIDKMFDYEGSDSIDKNPNKIRKISDVKNKEEGKISFKDLDVRLDSCEISKYSKLYDSLTVKFTDQEATYSLMILIDIKEAVPEDEETDFGVDDIEKCYIKFKKYDLDTFEIIGQISKNIKIKEISEETIIDLKIELDDKFNPEDEEFEIETE